MKSFKQHLAERTVDAYHVVSALSLGEFDNFEEFERYLLNNYEMETLGSGNFSYARSTTGGKDFVLKVSRSPLSYKEDAWWDFAKLARKNSGRNSLYPKIPYIGELPRFEGDEHRIGVAIIERLSIWARTPTVTNFSSSMIESLFARAFRYTSGPTPERLKLLMEHFEIVNNKIITVDLEEVIDFSKGLNSVSSALDLHDENFGLRADGSLVILDPLSWKD